jgi:agmatine deiminase
VVPDTLVVVYMPLWADALAALVAAAAPRADVVVLLATMDSEADGHVWLDAHGGERDGRVTILPTFADSPWARDWGPLQVRDAAGAWRWLDPVYDDRRPGDDALPATLAAHFGVRADPLPLDLDGGALISNGHGLCASTLESFADIGPAHVGAAAARRVLHRLGCRALALMPALVHDETGHADTFAQFVAPDVAVVGTMDPVRAPHDAARLDEAARGLARAARVLRQPLRIVRVPVFSTEPGVYHTYVNGVRLPDSFAVPHYDAVPSALETMAYAALQQAMPDVHLLPIPADAMVSLGGALHCITIGLNVGASDGS